MKAGTTRNSPDIEPIENMSLSSSMDTHMSNAPPGPQQQSLGTGAVQQPKVQTAFIHKLYNMLEDVNIQHLISWSASNESFVVSPTGEFSKVLSQYFKHTNISSFVRQLNMYGFHKVNDVFHTGSPDSTLWEFKHGNGNFKRGDLVGLREIKRRASRHALIHRDSFSGTKSAAVSVPGTPNEQPTDSVEARLLNIEQSLFDVSTRLARTEETNTYLSARCQIAVEGFSRCHRYAAEIAQLLSNAFPPDAPILREIQSLQKEIERRSLALDEPPRDVLRDPPTFTTTLVDNGVPLSPRQRPVEDDSRRSSFSGQPRSGYFRPPAPPSQPSRRLASAGISGSSSPNSLRPQRDPPQPIPHPLSNLQSQSPPNHLSRRHTSADIRQHGWQVNSPFSGIGQTPHWPPSPGKPPNDYRDGGYEMPHQPRPSIYAPQTTLSFNEGTGAGGGHEGVSWSFGTKFAPREAGHTAPPTRRSSLASSSVHALLNPPENATEREGVSDGEPDDRKRKRMM